MSSEALFFSFLRVSAFLVSSPFPGAFAPVSLRVVLSGGLALVFSENSSLPADVPWMSAVLVEVVAGLFLGFMVSLCLQIFTFAGEIGGAQAGLSGAVASHPLSVETNPLGALYSMLVVALFVASDGPQRAMTFLHHSFEVLPAGSAGVQIAERTLLDAGGWRIVASAGRLFFEGALRVASPVIASVFASHVLLGVLARAIPNLNWLVEGPSLTLSAGILGLVASFDSFMPLLVFVLERGMSIGLGSS